MILVFILLGIIILLLTIFFLFLISTFQIEIKNLQISNKNNISQDNIEYYDKVQREKNISDNHENKLEYVIVLSFRVFNKLKWFSIHLNDEKIRKIYNKMKLEKIDLRKIEKEFKFEDLKIMKKLEIKLSYLNLQMQLGTQNPITTAFLVTIFSTMISVILPYITTSMQKENYQYTIQPIYQKGNLYKIQFNCIIQVKIIHIINVILIFLKRKKTN